LYHFGIDKWGFDLLSMILHGLRFTIFISITIIKMLIGTIVGIYMGTWNRTPGWLVAFENAWSYIPLFLILYFFLQPITFNSPLSPITLIIYFVLVTSLISSPSIISSIRLKTQEFNKTVFIEASKTLGAGRHRIVWLHIFKTLASER
jgi:ABC-type dipeptide/oligopeptide/nickel transport system permease subunit